MIDRENGQLFVRNVGSGVRFRHLVFIRECLLCFPSYRDCHLGLLLNLFPFHHPKWESRGATVYAFYLSCLVSSVLIRCSFVLQWISRQTCDQNNTLRCSAARRRRGCGSARVKSVKCPPSKMARSDLQIQQTRWQTRWWTRPHRW